MRRVDGAGKAGVLELPSRQGRKNAHRSPVATEGREKVKITIEPTTQIIDVGCEARVWEGTTEDGTRVVLWITRVAFPPAPLPGLPPWTVPASGRTR